MRDKKEQDTAVNLKTMRTGARSGLTTMRETRTKVADVDMGAPTSKVSFPLRGKGVAITDKLHEINERKERIEMMNYQQKMLG